MSGYLYFYGFNKNMYITQKLNPKSFNSEQLLLRHVCETQLVPSANKNVFITE